MADIFDSYALANAWDEMFERPGVPRPAYQALFAALQPLGADELRFRADQLALVFTDRGVTFDYAGEERPSPRPDPAGPRRGRMGSDHPGRTATRPHAGGVPRRRVRQPPVFHDGVVPWRLLHSSPHFHRAADGIPARVRVHVAGIDIIRDEYGDFRVLEDNVLEYWTGEWTALDPTNRTEVGEGHVVVARGKGLFGRTTAQGRLPGAARRESGGDGRGDPAGVRSREGFAGARAVQEQEVKRK
jgi:hypothetical protein